jgi:iron complex outermembrane recepter protein
MHLPLSGRHGLFLRAILVLGLIVVLAIGSGFGQTRPASDVQKMAEFVITETKAVPYQNGNMDVPRTSNDVQPYTMINQEAILESNAYDLNNFLKDQLTQNTVVQDYSQLAPTAGANGNNGTSSQVNFRGLGNLKTLILVNGYRIPSYQIIGVQYQPNINGIPLGAIDHIEVLPSSASGIYGSSAVGGVLNVILKKNYSGGEFATSYQSTGDGKAPQLKVDGNFVFSIGKKIHVNLLASYTNGQPLRVKDRSYIMDYNRTVLQRAPGLFYSNTMPYAAGRTTNITLSPAVVNGYTNAQSRTLTLKDGTPLNAVTTYVPIGTSQSTSTATLGAGLVANAGKQNTDWAPSVFQGLNTPIGQLSTNKMIMASVRYDLSPRLELTTDFANRFSRSFSPLIQLGAGQTNFPVPGNAPTNPFRENVLVSLPTPVEQSAFTSNQTRLTTATIGLKAHLPGNWELATDYTWGESRLIYYKWQLALQLGLGQLNGANALLFNGTINPFVDTIANPPPLRDYYFKGYETGLDSSGDFNLRLSGPALTLPAGRVHATVALGARAEGFSTAFLWNIPPPVPGIGTNSELRVYPGGRQTVQGAGLETKVPIVAAKNNVRWVNSLDVQFAVRREDFQQVSNSGVITSFWDLTPPILTSTVVAQPTRSTFTSTNPTVGFKYQPNRTLTFRASYALAFIPPTAAQLTTNTNPNTTVTGAFLDPVTGRTYTTDRNAGTNGNPDLKPQISKSWNAGVIWAPQAEFLKGFRFNLEYYKIDEEDLIFSPANIQSLVSTPAYADNLTRDPVTNLITFANFRFSNVAEAYTDGWDVNVDYRKKTALGTFNLHAGATIVAHLKKPNAPGAPLLDYVGYVNSGGVNKVKGNVALSWYLGSHWTVGWRTVYYDGYKQAGAPGDPVYNGAINPTPITTSLLPQGRTTIPEQIYHNVFASYKFGEAQSTRHVLRGVTIQVGINDLFNTAPPFDANSSYAPYYYSPFGPHTLRSYILKIRKAF